MSAATIQDVARLANVSVATVSRVLNKSTAVKPATRDRVLVAIKELDYTPNLSARRLKTGRTLSIGVFLPFLTLPSYSERLRGVQKALADTIYDLVLVSAETADHINACVTNLLHSSRVDGAIVVSINLTPKHVEQFQQTGTSVVLVDSHYPPLNRVFVDDAAGGYQATQHLIGLGHSKIGFLSDYLDNPFGFVGMRHRFDGYCHALTEAGISSRQEYCQHGQLGGREAFQKAKNLLTLPDRPTAIFAASDTHAVGVLKAAHELGIRVPEELSVVGYDDIRDAEYLNLTTIKQYLFKMGMEATQLLLSSLEDPSAPTCEIRLQTELVLRGTTGPNPEGAVV
jgi:DNA-binding LacI/PurR family transcriptional regulator